MKQISRKHNRHIPMTHSNNIIDCQYEILDEEEWKQE